jgi:hypothetical protein
MEVITEEENEDSLFLHIPYDPNHNPFSSSHVSSDNINKKTTDTFPFTWDSLSSIGNDGINFESIEAKCSEFVSENNYCFGCGDSIFSCCSFDPLDTDYYDDLNKKEEIKAKITNKSKIKNSSGTFFSNLFFGSKKDKKTKTNENIPVKIKRSNYFDIHPPSVCLGDDINDDVDMDIMSAFDE